MIELKNISFSYQDNHVLVNFSDKFEDNKINCIIGPSGTGKTTIINLISRLISQSSGEIINSNQKISYVFQETRLIPQKTVFKNLEYILRDTYKEKTLRKRKILEYLKVVELDNVIDKYPHELSGGEAQRVSLIRAFAYPSTLLLLDEPFKSLDLQLKNSLIKYFLKLWETEKRTVIFITHEIDDALLIGDNIHIYSNAPVTLLSLININEKSIRTKLYDNELTELKKQILLEIEKW